MLYEKIKPVWSRKGDQLILKNLDVVSFVTTAASGEIDMSGMLISHPIIEDSIIAVTNASGDVFYVEQNSQVFENNKIKIGLSGSYTVSYQSSTINNQLLNGQSYITIGGEKVKLSPYTFKNTWDEYASLVNTKRRDGEDNISLKTRCQHLSILEREEQRISAALGKSGAFAWDTQSTFSLSGSGTIGLNVLNAEKTIIVEETLNKDGTNFVLTQVPSGYVQLFHNGTSVKSENYSVSGSLVIPTSVRLQEAEVGTVVARYTTVVYTLTTSGDYITSLTRQSGGKDSLLVVWSKNVKVVPSTKKIQKWRWNEELGTLTGSASFE